MISDHRDNLLFHSPVLLTETIEILNVLKNRWYIDATAGFGGHSQEIVKRGGKGLLIEQDTEAIKFLQEKFKSEIIQGQIIIQEGNFNQIQKIAQKHNLVDVQGILFDLGVSTFQIKSSKRGFSFLQNEFLDMRMGKGSLTACQIVNTYSKGQLIEIFEQYGEERLAGEISEKIINRRKTSEIRNTLDLANLVSGAYKEQHVKSKIHPGTKVFQALRIEVNNELENLQSGLESAWKLLTYSGRCAVISFHSLEDRIVKRFIYEKTILNQGKNLTKRPITTKDDELKINPQSRSAKLRAIQKL